MTSLSPKNQQNLHGLYLLLDPEVAGDIPLTDITTQAIDGGARLFQYRAKGPSRGEIYRVALELREITAAHNATLIINDWCDIALAVEADGVHLGQDDLPLEDARALLGPDRLIGISTHSLDQAVEAENGGADYIGFGPMYDTKTKDTGYTPRGPNAARELRAHVSIPIFGIGGINLTNITELHATGIDGIAVVSAILRAPEVDVAVKRFIAAWSD